MADRPGVLARIGVVVTRPEHQSDGLVRLLEAEGARVIRFPVLAIAPPRDEGPARVLARRLAEFDIAVFISTNAVERGMALIRSVGGLPPGLRLAAVGMASARALSRLGLSADLFPRGRFDSEALLALDGLQAEAISGCRILIFRGEGGREQLAATLRARGASVEYAEVYRRVRPAAPAEDLLAPLSRGEVDVIIVTSGEGLRNLLEMVGEAGRPWLYHTPLLVVSERIADLARALGWRTAPVVAARADDTALVEALVRRQSRHSLGTRGIP